MSILVIDSTGAGAIIGSQLETAGHGVTYLDDRRRALSRLVGCYLVDSFGREGSLRLGHEATAIQRTLWRNRRTGKKTGNNQSLSQAKLMTMKSYTSGL